MVGVIYSVKAAGSRRSTHNAPAWPPLTPYPSSAAHVCPLPGWPLQLTAPLCMILPCLPACVIGCVVGEEACFSMHLGAYGQAYFAAETMEIVSGKPREPHLSH